MKQCSFHKPVIIMMILLANLSFQAIARISGTVVDDNGKPVDGAAVIALQPADSTYIAGAVTDHTGRFTLDIPEKIENLTITAKAIGYDQQGISAKNGEDIRISLSGKSLSLSEVTVRPTSVEVSPGKFSFTPGNLTKYSPDAFSALEIVPLLYIDKANDRLEIIGKDKTTIYINGKQPAMSSPDVIKMLKASPPSRIKRIEVWVQPGVAFRDEGAIVNVVLAPQQGAYGTADMYIINTQERFQFMESGWMGYERGKWQFSGSLYLSQAQSLTKQRQEMTTFNPADGSVGLMRLSEKKGETEMFSGSANLGASIDLGHNNSLGVTLRYQSIWDLDTDYSDNISFPDTGTYEEINMTDHMPYTILTSNVNYYHTLDSLGSKLEGRISFSNQTVYVSGEYTPASLMYDYKNFDGKNSIEMKGSWTKAFTREGSMVLGFDIFHDRIKRTMNQSETAGVTGGNMPLTDDFRQYQTNFDIFVQGEYRFSNLFSLRLGVTGRWYRRDTRQMIGEIKKLFDDFYIMPDVSASFNFNPDNQLTLGYSSFVSQPYYSDTNPIVYRISPTQITTGNPYLKASTTHSLNLDYMLLQKISLGANMNLNNNLAVRTIIPIAEDLTANMPVELGTNRNTGVSASYSDAFFTRRWRVTAMANFNQYHYDSFTLYDRLNVNSADYSSWGFFLRSSVSIGHDRSWEISASFYFSTGQKQPLTNKASFNNLCATITKTFPFGATLQLYGENLLNCHRDSWYVCPEYSRYYYDLTNNRRIMLSFSMTFGKQIRMRRNAEYSDLERRL